MRRKKLDGAGDDSLTCVNVCPANRRCRDTYEGFAKANRRNRFLAQFDFSGCDKGESLHRFSLRYRFHLEIPMMRRDGQATGAFWR